MSEAVWTIGSLLQWTEQYFRNKGIASPRLDGEVLLSHMLQKERIYCYAHYDQPLTKAELAAFKALLLERVSGRSVAAITGQKEFMGLSFRVNDQVLIPRPDTETLVEGVLQLFSRSTPFRILDMCVGSGAIAWSLLHYAPLATAVGVDISPEALAIAKENLTQLGLADRGEIYQSDLFQGLSPDAMGTFSVITSNPPYIPSADIAALDPEVQAEPHIALDGGTDGLVFYRRLVTEALPFLEPGGYLVLEIGAGQEQDVAALAADTNAYEEPIYWKDLGGHIRNVVLQKRA